MVSPVERSKIFFSYSREDAEFVLHLAKELRAAGADLWLDQLDIPAGARWDTAVQSALENCECLVVVLSPASVASSNVMDEVSYALEKGKTVIPILHRKCDVPFRARRLQYLDFTTGYDKGFPRLLSELKIERPADTQHCITDKAQSTTAPKAPPLDKVRSLPKGMIVGFIALAIVLLGVTYFKFMRPNLGDGPTVIDGLELPTYVILDSAFKTKEQAQKRLVELYRSGYSNTGFFWIPNFDYLSGKKLFQVYVGPFDTEERAKEAICEYVKRMKTTTYGVRLSTEPGRKEFRCSNETPAPGG